jgi:hypothetical protein
MEAGLARASFGWAFFVDGDLEKVDLPPLPQEGENQGAGAEEQDGHGRLRE